MNIKIIDNLNTETSNTYDCLDTNDKKIGKDGLGCSSYEIADCGTQDNDDFKSKEMCCICGGGRNGTAMNENSGMVYAKI